MIPFPDESRRFGCKNIKPKMKRVEEKSDAAERLVCAVRRRCQKSDLLRGSSLFSPRRLHRNVEAAGGS